MLEQTLVKIGGLLALGFGEAGSNIIAKNMSGSEDINPMMPGQKVICIFGFCDIRNFTDATEELQEGVMLFVNEIGEIVHGLVDRYSGAANKNIGDAFLIVWKFDDDSQYLDEATDEISLVPHLKVNQLCDMAMISFLKIMAALKRSRKMKVYSKHEGLNRRMPGYTVRLGYGLHLGWAIEGAIGSYYKIDASYLSPHVNMSNKLEEMTKSFGAPLLISGAIYDWFTDGTKAMIRQIDHVQIKGMAETLRLYTCDAYIEELVLEEEKAPLTRQQKKQERVKARISRDQYKEKIVTGEIQVSGLFETDKDLLEMRSKFTQAFFDTFNDGFRMYIEGNWNLANKILKSVQMLKKMPDGPSESLMKVMKEHDFKAPEDWPGYR